MVANIKEAPNFGVDTLKSFFEELHVIVAEPEPNRLAEEDVKSVVEMAARRLVAAADETRRLDLETEMYELTGYQDVLDYIADNFDIEKSKEAMSESAQVILGRWLNSAMTDLTESQLSRMDGVLNRFKGMLDQDQLES